MEPDRWSLDQDIAWDVKSLTLREQVFPQHSFMPETLLFGVPTWQLEVSAYDTIPNLRTMPMANSPTWSQRAIAMVFGSAAAFDGNILWYAWNPTDVRADDGITVIKPDSIVTEGRWNLCGGFGTSFTTAICA